MDSPAFSWLPARWSLELRHRRDALRERGDQLRASARDGGLRALSTARGRALDARRALAERRKSLRPEGGGVAGATVKLIESIDRLLATFGDRARLEAARLRAIELPAVAEKPDGDDRAANDGASNGRGSDDASSGRAREPVRARRSSLASTKLVMPIAGYDALTAKEILAELPRLTAAQLDAIAAFEREHKRRKTILNAIAARQQQN